MSEEELRRKIRNETIDEMAAIIDRRRKSAKLAKRKSWSEAEYDEWDMIESECELSRDEILRSKTQ